MESRMSFLRRNVVRKGLMVLGLAATLAVGASQASAQEFRYGGQPEFLGGQYGYAGGGYRGAPRRPGRVNVQRRGHYDYHPGGVHYDRVYHPEYSHWTPFQGFHTHGHYDVTPHATPGHYDYHRGGHSGGHHH
jgi:hypothetical protein